MGLSVFSPLSGALIAALAAVTSGSSLTLPMPAHAQAGNLASRGVPIRIGGSSTVLPIMERAVRDFQARFPGVRVELSETGTSGGFRQFCAGKLDLANASRPISSAELKACAANGISFVELPIAFDAITVVVHPSNNWAKAISTRELARLWGAPAQGTIQRWSQVNDDWPDRPIALCGPGADSGTFDYFNKAINGKEKNSRRDYTASEDDNELVRCVNGNPNALGYFGFGYFKANANRLRALAVDGPKGSVSPSVANVQRGRYVPLSRPLFVYVNDKALRQRADLRSFVTMTVANGMRLAEGAGSIPLPPSTYRLVESKLFRHVLGTSFGGDLPVGLTIGEAIRRSFDQHKKPQFR